MFSDLGTCLRLWGFLRSAGTSLDGVGWSTCKKWSKQVRVLVAYRENMNVHIHKNKVTLRRSREHRTSRRSRECRTSRRSRELNCQCRDVPEAAIFNIVTLGSKVATFQRVTQIRASIVATSQRRDVATQRHDVTEKKTQLFEKQISKVKSTPLFRFRFLSNPSFDYPSYLSAAASILEPENRTTRISYGLRENLRL